MHGNQTGGIWVTERLISQLTEEDEKMTTVALQGVVAVVVVWWVALSS